MKPLISVIIPIYGVEKYLRRAVDSVLRQTYSNLDIILVDDGSKDDCPAIADSYAKKEARVRVIHKENGGLSDARNAGLDVAGGDYIAFLDSDDYYAPQFIEVLYTKLCQTNADVAICTYELTSALDPEDGPDFAREIRKLKIAEVDISVYDRKQLLLNQYDSICPDATYFIVAWNKLYKAGAWKNIRFPKGKIHEDEATIYRVFDRINRGVYIRMPLYAYFEAPSSITRDAFHVKRLDWMDALDDRITFFESIGETDGVNAAIRARADGSIRYYYPLKKNVKAAKAEKKRLKNYVRAALKHGFLPFTTKAGYRLFLVSPGLYRLITKVGT